MTTPTIDYQEYLLSERWKLLAEETKRLAGYRCQVCNSDGELHAHHRTYERIGNELQRDLIALCDSCHALFHGKHDASTDKSGWALTRSLAAELSVLRAVHATTERE